MTASSPIGPSAASATDAAPGTRSDGQPVESLAEEAGRSGLVATGAAVLGALPLIFVLGVFLVANDYALLRTAGSQINLFVFLVICIPILPLWILAAGRIAARAVRTPTRKRRVWRVCLPLAATLALLSISLKAILILVGIAVVAGLAFWLAATSVAIAYWPLILARRLKLRFTGPAAAVLALLAITTLLSGGPSQAARSVILRGFTQEDIQFCQWPDESNGSSGASGEPEPDECGDLPKVLQRRVVYVLAAGDQFTTVVEDRSAVELIKNSTIINREECVPRLGPLGMAPLSWLLLSLDEEKQKTPHCRDLEVPLSGRH